MPTGRSLTGCGGSVESKGVEDHTIAKPHIESGARAALSVVVIVSETNKLHQHDLRSSIWRNASDIGLITPIGARS